MQKLALFSLLLLFSCKKDSNSRTTTPASPKSEGAWPIIPGNYWVYTDSVFSNYGSMYVNTGATVNTTDTAMYQGHVFYGKDSEFSDSYYRQVDDSTNESYSSVLKSSSLFFKQVKVNNTIILNTEEDATVFINNENKNYHIVNTGRGFSEVTNINGYDCVRNEFVQTYSGDTTFKSTIYVKPGVGVVRQVVYKMDQVPGKIYLYLIRNLVSYKLK